MCLVCFFSHRQVKFLKCIEENILVLFGELFLVKGETITVARKKGP